MRLLFIRHGDPDYENDTVTEKGAREALLLCEKLQNECIDAAYVSPMGRARRTAQPTLERHGMQGVVLDWLQEFIFPVRHPDTGKEHLIWDFMPEFMDRHPRLYSASRWTEEPFIRDSEVPSRYRAACDGLDALLAKYGYDRRGTCYAAREPNRKTLAFFCHFGATCVLLSHLFNLSPIPLLQHFVAAPTSVTTVYTEERECGIASFRCASYGDISHLYVAHEPPSFSARFCETFADQTERH